MPTKGNKKKSTSPPQPEKVAKNKGSKDIPIRPTILKKHGNILKKMSGNVGKGKKPSVKQAAIEMGYSESYADSGRLQKTRTWKQALDHYLPEDKLLKVHDQQLNSYRLQSMIFQKQIDDEIIYELIESINAVLKKIVEIPTGKVVFYITADNQSRNKALEMGLKLHKRLTDKVEVRDTTPYAGLTDTELAARIKQGKKFFLKK